MGETKFFKNRRVIILLVIAIVAIGSAFGLLGFNQGDVEAEYFTAQIKPGDIIKSISATGAIQPLVTVQVGSQVSGTIAQLFADFNSVVKKGQVVAKLDPAIFQAQLNQAEANLANAEATVQAARSAVTNAEANLLAAQANRERARVAMEDAQRLLKRTVELQENDVVSQRDLESAQAAADQTAAQYRQAEAQVGQAKAQLLSSKSQLKQAQAQVLQAKAAVELASVTLSHTIIAAPIDGVVVARDVDVGQTVAASLQAPTLFQIANDLTMMQVLADIDEADVGQIGPQSLVSFTVDAYPRDTFRGRIAQLRLNPQTEQTVVTYTAVIDVDNPDLKLKPGMTANITVTVGERRNVLKVPNGALRFRPQLTAGQRKEVAALMKGVGPGGGLRPYSVPAEATNGDGKWERNSADGSEPKSVRRQAFGNGQQDALAANRPGQRPPLVDQRTQTQPGLTLTTETIAGWSPKNSQRPRVRVIWLLGDDGQIKPVRVKLGLTDGISTELVEGDLKPNDVVVIGQTIEPNGDAQRASSPFGGPFGRHRR